jgi:hypothetical protein
MAGSHLNEQSLHGYAAFTADQQYRPMIASGFGGPAPRMSAQPEYFYDVHNMSIASMAPQPEQMQQHQQ